MQAETMVTTLKSLKLFGMAQAIATLASQGAPAYTQAESILNAMLKAEVAEREVRSVSYQMKIARFPAYRDLASFEFGASLVDEALIRSLHRCEFLDDAHNVVLVGGPGTGKTHLATALGIQAMGSTPFPRTVELRLKTPGHAGRLYAAFAGCGTARGSRTGRHTPRRVYGTGDGSPARA
jgi:DNA replication protein DnaC